MGPRCLLRSPLPSSGTLGGCTVPRFWGLYDSSSRPDVWKTPAGNWPPKMPLRFKGLGRLVMCLWFLSKRCPGPRVVLGKARRHRKVEVARSKRRHAAGNLVAGRTHRQTHATAHSPEFPGEPPHGLSAENLSPQLFRAERFKCCAELANRIHRPPPRLPGSALCPVAVSACRTPCVSARGPVQGTIRPNRRPQPQFCPPKQRLATLRAPNPPPVPAALLLWRLGPNSWG